MKINGSLYSVCVWEQKLNKSLLKSVLTFSVFKTVLLRAFSIKLTEPAADWTYSRLQCFLEVVHNISLNFCCCFVPNYCLIIAFL